MDPAGTDNEGFFRMTLTLRERAALVRMTVARSGDHYLLADRWSEWQTVDGSPLLTLEQAEALVLEEIEVRGRSANAG